MLKRLFYYAGQYKRNFYISLVLITAGSISEVLAFVGVYYAMDAVIGNTADSFRLLVCGAAIIFFYLLKCVLFPKGLDFSHKFAYHVLCRLRLRFAEKITRLPLGEVLSKGAGSYRQNFVDDIEQIEILLAHGLPEGIPYLITCIVVYIALFLGDYRLGLLGLLHLPIGLLSMTRMALGSVKVNDSYYESIRKLNKSIIEYVAGMKVIKIFGSSVKSYEKVNQVIDEHEGVALGWFKGNLTNMAVFQSVMPSTVLFVLPVGLYMVYKETLSLPLFLFGLVLLFSISSPLLKLMEFFPAIYHLQKKIAVLEAGFQSEELTAHSGGAVRGNDIQLNDVCFSYEAAEVIHGVRIHIKEGERVAFVGESGSGKSTLAKLIMHYWDVDSGEVLVGGRDIRETTVETLMERIGFVSQDHFLFNISIKDNIQIGRPEATDEEIFRAAEIAQCHDFILGLEHGYDTMAGDCGDKLSGGERQRITIARALLKNAPIVILDEATSSTDPENEKKINQGIAHLTEGKTLIVIAHKLSSVMDFDRLYLIDKGRLADSGTHEQLLRNPLYANLWERYVQSSGYEFDVKEQRNV